MLTRNCVVCNCTLIAGNSDALVVSSSMEGSKSGFVYAVVVGLAAHVDGKRVIVRVGSVVVRSA